MKKTIKPGSRILIIMAVILLIAAVAYQHFKGNQLTLDQLQIVFPEAESYQIIDGAHVVYQVYSDNDKVIGYYSSAEASGYGGKILVGVGFDTQGQIIASHIGKHIETPWFLNRVIELGFMDQFPGKAVYDKLQLHDDLDAVSGATLSSEGIANAVRKAAQQVGESRFGITAEKSGSFFSVELVILFLIIIIIYIGNKFKISRLRPTVLIISVFTLGFWLNSPIALGNLTALISGNLPSLNERPFWYLLILGTIVLVISLGRNVYCYWLCPYGAVQEALHRVLPIFRYKPASYLEEIAHKVRWVVVWVAVMAAVLIGNPSLASYEPFSVFFKAQGNHGQWIIMLLVLVMAVPVYRFWCRFFCPVGAVLDLLAMGKSLIKREGASAAVSNQKRRPQGCTGNGNCKECQVKCYRSEQRKVEISPNSEPAKQPIFSLVLLIMMVFIIYTLALNIGLA